MLTALGRPAVDPQSSGSVAAFTEYLAVGDGIVLVAEWSGGIVGVASLHFRPRLNWQTQEAWIADLHVREDARRRGVARLLVDRCVEEARARGCHLLRLDCGVDRDEAHGFYREYGFEARGYDYQLVLR